MLSLFVILLLILFYIGVIWRRRRARKQREQRIEQLRQWAAEHRLLEPALQQWIQRLPAPEAQILLELLDGYCTSLNWELNWLFAPQIKKAPALKLALEENVSAYARAVLHSLQMEADVRAYQAYVTFEQKPHAPKQKSLVQQLYHKVNDETFVPPTKRFFSRFGRKNHTNPDQVAIIQQAFERDPARAMAALKEVLATDAANVAMQVRQEMRHPMHLAPASA